MPNTRAKLDAFISDLHLRVVGPVIIIVRQAHGAVVQERRVHPGGERGIPREAGVLLAALLGRLVVGLLLRRGGCGGEQRTENDGGSLHGLLASIQLPPEGACAWITAGFSIGGRRISCSRLGRSRRW